MKSRIRQTINNATRHINIEKVRQKGTARLRHLIVNSLVSIQAFKFFLVEIFQEAVIDELIEEMYKKLVSLSSIKKNAVIEELANRYIQFAELGYVFVFKNYLDRMR